MAIAWLLVVVGIAGLVWSADRFVNGSAALANNLGMSKIVIGLTIVSFGTSAPEILVSLNASLLGNADMAIGNALGSNIANIGLVLAVTALIAAIPIQYHLLVQEIPALILITALAGLFLFDSQLSRWEGWTLLLVTIPLLYLMFIVKRRHPAEVDIEAEGIPDMSTARSIFWFLVGLVTLILSARILVSGAETIAIQLGVSKLVIGLTVVAIGTSLPELAASVVSAIKGHHDIALGNIIGSNIFNILAVMSIPGIVGMTAMEDKVFYRDFAAVGIVTALLGLAILGEIYWERAHHGSFLKRARRQFWPRGSEASLGPVIGLILLLCYIGYSVLLFYTETPR